MSDKIKCPSCGKEIKATAKFCGFCATKIEVKPVEKIVEHTDENSGAYVNPLEGVTSTRGTRCDKDTTQPDTPKSGKTGESPSTPSHRSITGVVSSTPHPDFKPAGEL